MPLLFESYAAQTAVWPKNGHVILAQFDDDTVVVYQAYRPSIARYAVEHQQFGGDFSFSRMSWIKPNFLWMMYRSGWASKEGQEHVLAVRIRRAAFVRILAAAVHSTYVADVYGTRAEWDAAVARSQVRLQWDPDHAPSGAPVERRAVQLGLRGDVLRAYATTDVVSIEDVSEFCRAQHALVRAGRVDDLTTPRERPFPVEDPQVAKRLGIDA